jgi:hypothetical protein
MTKFILILLTVTATFLAWAILFIPRQYSLSETIVVNNKKIVAENFITDLKNQDYYNYWILNFDQNLLSDKVFKKEEEEIEKVIEQEFEQTGRVSSIIINSIYLGPILGKITVNKGADDRSVVLNVSTQTRELDFAQALQFYISGNRDVYGARQTLLKLKELVEQIK